MLPEYRNLTQSELAQADHYAETGNTAGLRQMQRTSSEREGRYPKGENYNNPMQPRKTR